MSQTANQSLPPATRSREDSITTSSSWARPLRQFGLFFVGAGFMAASIAVSRRSVLRRKRESFPKFYSHNGPAPKVYGPEGSLLGVQALGLATLNVSSFAVMLVGGLSFGFDLSSVDELRDRTRVALNRPGHVDPEDEREFEKMMNDMLGKLGLEQYQTNQAEESLSPSQSSKE